MKKKSIIVAQGVTNINRKISTIEVVQPKHRCPFCKELGAWGTESTCGTELKCKSCNLTWDPDITYLVIEL